jgi:hypothetical protein
LCFVNTEADEVIRSLFLCKNMLITISIFSGGELPSNPVYQACAR